MHKKKAIKKQKNQQQQSSDDEGKQRKKVKTIMRKIEHKKEVFQKESMVGEVNDWKKTTNSIFDDVKYANQLFNQQMYEDKSNRSLVQAYIDLQLLGSCWSYYILINIQNNQQLYVKYNSLAVITRTVSLQMFIFTFQLKSGVKNKISLFIQSISEKIQYCQYINPTSGDHLVNTVISLLHRIELILKQLLTTQSMQSFKQLAAVVPISKQSKQTKKQFVLPFQFANQSQKKQSDLFQIQCFFQKINSKLLSGSKQFLNAYPKFIDDIVQKTLNLLTQFQTQIRKGNFKVDVQSNWIKNYKTKQTNSFLITACSFEIQSIIDSHVIAYSQKNIFLLKYIIMQRDYVQEYVKVMCYNYDKDGYMSLNKTIPSQDGIQLYKIYSPQIRQSVLNKTLKQPMSKENIIKQLKTIANDKSNQVQAIQKVVLAKMNAWKQKTMSLAESFNIHGKKMKSYQKLHHYMKNYGQTLLGGPKVQNVELKQLNNLRQMFQYILSNQLKPQESKINVQAAFIIKEIPTITEDLLYSLSLKYQQVKKQLKRTRQKLYQMIVGNTILMKPLSDDKINIVFKTYEVTKNDILLLSVYLAQIKNTSQTVSQRVADEIKSKTKIYQSGMDIYSKMKQQALKQFQVNNDEGSTEILQNNYFNKLSDLIMEYDGQIDDKLAAINLYLCALNIDEQQINYINAQSLEQKYRFYSQNLKSIIQKLRLINKTGIIQEMNKIKKQFILKYKINLRNKLQQDYDNQTDHEKAYEIKQILKNIQSEIEEAQIISLSKSSLKQKITQTQAKLQAVQRQKINLKQRATSVQQLAMGITQKTVQQKQLYNQNMLEKQRSFLNQRARLHGQVYNVNQQNSMHLATINELTQRQGQLTQQIDNLKQQYSKYTQNMQNERQKKNMYFERANQKQLQLQQMGQRQAEYQEQIRIMEDKQQEYLQKIKELENKQQEYQQQIETYKKQLQRKQIPLGKVQQQFKQLYQEYKNLESQKIQIQGQGKLLQDLIKQQRDSKATLQQQLQNSSTDMKQKVQRLKRMQNRYQQISEQNSLKDTQIQALRKQIERMKEQEKYKQSQKQEKSQMQDEKLKQVIAQTEKYEQQLREKERKEMSITTYLFNHQQQLKQKQNKLKKQSTKLVQDQKHLNQMLTVLYGLTNTSDTQGCIQALKNLILMYEANKNNYQAQMAIRTIAQTFKSYTGADLTPANMVNYFVAVKQKEMNLGSQVALKTAIAENQRLQVIKLKQKQVKNLQQLKLIDAEAIALRTEIENNNNLVISYNAKLDRLQTQQAQALSQMMTIRQVIQTSQTQRYTWENILQYLETHSQWSITMMGDIKQKHGLTSQQRKKLWLQQLNKKMEQCQNKAIQHVSDIKYCRNMIETSFLKINKATEDLTLYYQTRRKKGQVIVDLIRQQQQLKINYYKARVQAHQASIRDQEFKTVVSQFMIDQYRTDQLTKIIQTKKKIIKELQEQITTRKTMEIQWKPFQMARNRYLYQVKIYQASLKEQRTELKRFQLLGKIIDSPHYSTGITQIFKLKQSRANVLQSGSKVQFQSVMQLTRMIAQYQSLMNNQLQIWVKVNVDQKKKQLKLITPQTQLMDTLYKSEKNMVKMYKQHSFAKHEFVQRVGQYHCMWKSILKALVLTQQAFRTSFEILHSLSGSVDGTSTQIIKMVQQFLHGILLATQNGYHHILACGIKSQKDKFVRELKNIGGKADIQKIVSDIETKTPDYQTVLSLEQQQELYHSIQLDIDTQ